MTIPSSALAHRFSHHARRPRAIRRHTGRVATRVSILVAGDICAIALARFAIRWMAAEGVFAQIWAGGAPLVGSWRRFGLFAVLVVAAVFATGGHSRHRALNQPIRLLAGTLAACAVVWIPRLQPFLGTESLAAMLSTALVIWLAIMLVRRLSEAILREIWPRARGAGAALLIGTPDGSSSAVERAISAPGGDYRIIGHIATSRQDRGDALGSLNDLPALIETREVEAVVVCAELSTDVASMLIEECLRGGCQILYPARALKVPGIRPALVWHRDQPFFELGSPVLKAKALITKRVTDVIGSLVLLLVSLPFLGLVALAVYIDSPGAPLFLQERAGLAGRRFRMVKFRTMRYGADSEKENLSHLNATGDQRLFKIREDPRITRLGRVLRRWSVDELPQLWNVLVGEMSLVGPRPFFESDFASYEDHHFRRLDAKPGITGLWQVSGRSEVLDFEDVIYLDRQYIEQWSFWLDVSILFRTLPAVFRRTGAY